MQPTGVAPEPLHGVHMIDFDAIASARLQPEPFDWARVDCAIPEESARALLEAFPHDEFWELTHADAERQWHYEARPLVPLGAGRVSWPGELPAVWQQLVADLLSPAHREAVESLIGRSLEGAAMEASVVRWETGGHLSPHTDLAEKIVTEVFYLSGDWDPEWGGDLRILRSASPDDVFVEVPPLGGLASVLVRSDRSWHSVAPVRATCQQPRRNVLVTWHHPGAESVVWDVDARGRTRCRSSRKRSSPAASVPRPRSAPAERATRTPRIAIVGTFNVENLGDLLFPLVAEHELRERLGPVELSLYSFGAKAADDWPYEVRSLTRLPAEIQDFDLLLVGGGQIVRYDATWLIPSFGPDGPDVHNPLGLWLTPSLLAAAAGVPIAWNAPGVSAGLPPWTRPLVAAALESADSVTVRDQGSADRLCAEAEVGASLVEVVPDTAFTVRRLLPASGRTRELERLRSELGLANDAGYVVVQAGPELSPCLGAVRELLRAARDEGLAVVELPVSPAHGDAPGALDLGVPVHSTGGWPHPLVCAELIAGAASVIASAFHAGVVATACGVPLARPRGDEGTKFDTLESLARVTILPEDGSGESVESLFGAAPPAPEQAGRESALDAHWDRLAALIRDDRAPAWPGLVGLAAELPFLLEEGAEREAELTARIRELEGHSARLLHDAEAGKAELIERIRDLEAQAGDLEGHAARLEALCGRRSARLAVAVADRTNSLRRRSRA